MATSGDLVKQIALVTGLPLITVKTHYRRMRESGLVPKAGRGPVSSLRMTAEIAATLLVSIGGRFLETEAAKDVVDRFRNVRSTGARYSASVVTDEPGHEAHASGPGEFRFGIVDVPILEALPEGHNIEEAITALVGSFLEDPSAPESEFYQDHWWRVREHFEGYEVRIAINVEFHGPSPAADIKVEIVAQREDNHPEPMQTIELELRYSDARVAEALEQPGLIGLMAFSRVNRADFRGTRSFTEQTLERAAMAIDDFELETPHWLETTEGVLHKGEADE